MSRLMQAELTLKGAEIDFAEGALRKSVEGYSASGMADMARPYGDILEQFRSSRRCGSGAEARIRLAGGAIECMKSALRGADDQAEGARLAELLRKRTRGLDERYA